MAKTKLHKLLENLVEDFTPEIRDAFLNSIQDIVDSVILSDLISAVRNGDVDRAFSMLGFSEASLRGFTDTIETSFARGGVVTAEAFPKRLRTVTGAKFRFDTRTPRAETWLREKSSRKVVDISESARVVVRNVISRGVQDGVNPRTTALDIIGRIDRQTGHRSGGSIGLAPNQETWVANVERKLRELDPDYFNNQLRYKRADSIVSKAIAQNKPLTNEQIQKLVSRYRDNALRYRGEAIARSEAIESLNRGQWEALKQGVDNGAISQAAVKRFWDSAGDDGRTRDSHLDMDGVSVGLDEPFRFASGANLMFPGDRQTASGDEKAIAKETIQCRCRVRTEIDWFAGVT